MNFLLKNLIQLITIKKHLKIFLYEKNFFLVPTIDSQVATLKSVKNSIQSLIKYSNKFEVSLLNVFGEWDNFIMKKFKS